MSNANEAAYPQNWATGLTKRELLAAMAMQGLLARNKTHEWMEYEISISAVSQADALLAELAKPIQ